MNQQHEEILREVVEHKATQRQKEEQNYLLLLSVIFDLQLNKHQDLIRKIYEKFSVDGLLPREELFKYGRDKSIRKSLTDIFVETGREEIKLIRNSLKTTINEHYAYTLYSLSVMGLNPIVKPLKTAVVNDIVDLNWTGKNIVDIVKKDKMEQISRAYNQLVMAATQGLQLKQVISDSKKLHENSINKSMLNYQTETTRVKDDVANKAAGQVKRGNKWIIIVTLDERTCKQCAPLDKKVFTDDRPIKLPVHSRCRCTKTFYLPSEEFLRRARNPDTNQNYLVDDVAYKEWIQTAYKK